MLGILTFYYISLCVWQGSWMVQFLTVIVSLYLFSHAYNVVLVLTCPDSSKYTINSKMGVSNSRLVQKRNKQTKNVIGIEVFWSLFAAL